LLVVGCQLSVVSRGVVSADQLTTDNEQLTTDKT
jgi:hypothetical protein